MANTLNMRRRVLEAVDFLVPKHGVGLSGTSGAISEASGVEATQYGLNKFLSSF
jgi:hypothetical protein